MKFKRSTQIASMVLLFAIIFTVSFWLDLSSEKLSNWLEFQLNRYVDKRIQINILNANTRIWGISIEELVFVQKKDGEKILNLHEIEVKIDPYTLLNRWGIGVDAKLYHGKMETAWRFYPEVGIDYSLRDVKINQNAYLRKINVIGLDPKVSGEGSILLAEDMMVKKAALDLELDHLVLKSNDKYLYLPLKLPDTDIKNSSFKLDYDNKLLNIDIHLAGDVKAKIKGSVSGPLEEYKKLKLNIRVMADLSRSYRNKLGFVKAILDTYSDKSGKLSIHLSGSSSSPIIKKL